MVIVDEPPKSTRAAPAPAPVTDPQYLAYCLESAALLHNLGKLHHDRGTEGSNDAMKAYSQSIQMRIKAQNVAEASAKRFQLHVLPLQQQQQQLMLPAAANDDDDRPTLDAMANHLTDLRERSSDLHRAAAQRRADAGSAYVYPHDTPATLLVRRGDTAMVGMNAFTRPLLLPVSEGYDPRLPGHEFVSSMSYPFQQAQVHVPAAGMVNCAVGVGSSAGSAGATTGTAQQQQPPRRRGGLKRSTPLSHLINPAGVPGYQPQPYHSPVCTVSCNTGVSCCNGPMGLFSEVQKVNSLAAFTLYNIGLLHQTDRSHKEARESYEISSSVLSTMPAHLGQRTAVALLSVMIRNNLGYLAYRTEQYDVAAEHFQVASNASLDLSLMYAPTAAMSPNPTLEGEGVRTTRRRLGRSNVATLCNLSLALGRLGQNRRDALDVANAALQLSTRMEEEARQYRVAMAAAAATGNGSNLPNDEDGLDLTILPYVRGRAHHDLNNADAAIEQYRSFLSAVERNGHRSSHPYSVAAMQQILTLSQSDALAAIEELLRKVGDGHTAAAA